MTQKRKRLSGPEKVAIVKRYLIDRVAIPDLCDEYGLQPCQIKRRHAALFEHGADVFDPKKGRRAKAGELAKDAQIARIEAVVAQNEAKIAKNNEVISELTEENVLAKKPVGAPEGTPGSPRHAWYTTTRHPSFADMLAEQKPQSIRSRILSRTLNTLGPKNLFRIPESAVNLAV